MEYARAKMEKILLLALKIVDVTMMAHANHNEEKILYRVQMIVSHPLVMKMVYVNLKMARTRQIAQMIVNHPLVMKMVYVNLKMARTHQIALMTVIL
jgi:hypothetical protein